MNSEKKMAEELSDEENPLPFRRERNLSSRNFTKRYVPSFRPTFRVTGVDLEKLNTVLKAAEEVSEAPVESEGMISHIPQTKAKVVTEKEPPPTHKDLIAESVELVDDLVDLSSTPPSPSSPTISSTMSSIVSSDPTWIGVKQKVLNFEKSYSTIPLKPIRMYAAKSRVAKSPPQVVGLDPGIEIKPETNITTSVPLLKKRNESVVDEGVEASETTTTTDEEVGRMETFKRTLSVAMKNLRQGGGRLTPENLDDNYKYSMESTNSSNLTQTSSQSVESLHETKSSSITQKLRKRSFARNFRSNPRPKTEIIGVTTASFADFEKYHTLHKAGGNRIIERNIKGKETEAVNRSREEEDVGGGDSEIQLRDKGFKPIQPILDELIRTEQTYIKNLWLGINNYGDIFDRSDLPRGLRGKRYVLLGNIEQIAEFHRDEFLPMLLRNRNNLKCIFDEFKQFIMDNCFYGYVLFTMNKQRSLKLCDVYKDYFKVIQSELGDRLGINSFLVQPIQRMARYPLLLHQFINTLFKHRDYGMKPIIESCCRLEKRLRNLLATINESEIVNDIVCLNDNTEFNTFYQGKFRKVSEFHVFDHTLKRHYRSKVFIFDKCIIYTEIKGKELIFHGRYPCERIGIVAKTKSFTLYYEQRKQQECDFMGDQNLVESWLDLMKDMVAAYAREERKRIMALKFSPLGGCFEAVGSGENSIQQQGGPDMQVSGMLTGGTQPTTNLSLFRDSNRFSADSGIGNIWVMPKPDQDEMTEMTTTTMRPCDKAPPPMTTTVNSPTSASTTTRTTWYMKA